MTSLTMSYMQQFKEGKWEACSQTIRQMFDNLSKREIEEDDERHARRIALNNNLFVCDQLSKDWSSGTEENISQGWVKSYCAVSDELRLLRCQHICSKLPLDLILCVTCNVMWWSLMKVDPFQQHSCEKGTISAAIHSLKTIGEVCGGWNPYLFDNSIEANFIDAVDASISCLLKLTPVQCQLAIEVISMGFLIILDNSENSNKKPGTEFYKTIDNLVDILPQLKVHCLYEQTSVISKFESLVKFGWKEIGEVLSETSIEIISQVLLLIISTFCLRDNSGSLEENSLKSLKYLNLIDKNNLQFPFLFHYLYALSNFNGGNLDNTLYHLERSSQCSSNLFMQGRLNLLKGQTLLLQDKGAAALCSLQSVHYKRKEVQLPLCAFLIGKAYQTLGKVKQQIEVFDLLLECLSAEPAVQPKLCSPLAGMEHRLLLAVHCQPEVNYQEVLRSTAVAHLSAQQPKEAAEKFLELLHVKSIAMDDDFGESRWKLSELLHDTASALLEAYCTHDAEQICEAALQFHSDRLELDELITPGFSSLQEDVIALILLAEVKNFQECADVSGILNRCVRLLQTLIDRVTKLEEAHKEMAQSAKSLLARVFLQKALINVRRKFDDDAIAYFQRALSCNDNDREIILHFARHLLDKNQLDESLALWRMFKDAKGSTTKTNSIALNYLLGEKMDEGVKEEILCRLESLETML